jgi:hypothetical protein
VKPDLITRELVCKATARYLERGGNVRVLDPEPAPPRNREGWAWHDAPYEDWLGTYSPIRAPFGSTLRNS